MGIQDNSRILSDGQHLYFSIKLVWKKYLDIWNSVWVKYKHCRGFPQQKTELYKKKEINFPEVKLRDR